MAIVNEDTKIKLSGDGVETVFTFPFKIYKKTDVVVWLVDKETDEIEEQSLGSNYKVRINRTGEGGEVEFITTPVAAPPADKWVFMFSELEYTQGVVLPTDGAFREEKVSNGMDRLCRLIQQVREKVNRAVLQSPLVEEIDLTIPIPESNKVLGWDENGERLENKLPLDADAVADAQQARDDAVTAKEGAETAQGNAEEARDDAIEAKEAAEAVAGWEIASQAQAEAGEDNETVMTPLRVKQAIQLAYPVGSIFLSVNDTNPEETLGFGTWELFGEGKTLIGVDDNDADFDDSEKTGGAKTHTLTTAQMPSHNHTINVVSASGSGHTGIESGSWNNNRNRLSTNNLSSTGGGEAHNNLQPYITCYFWKRTA